jgi:hypothetical protein
MSPICRAPVTISWCNARATATSPRRACSAIAATQTELGGNRKLCTRSHPADRAIGEASTNSPPRAARTRRLAPPERVAPGVRNVGLKLPRRRRFPWGGRALCAARIGIGVFVMRHAMVRYEPAHEAVPSSVGDEALPKTLHTIPLSAPSQRGLERGHGHYPRLRPGVS